MRSWRQRSVAVLTVGVALGVSGLPVAAAVDTDAAAALPAPVILQPELPERADFGWAVSVDDDTVLVGASDEDAPENRRGAVRVYVPSGTTWVQQARLRASDGAEEDYFGYSTSLDGDTAVISAPYEDNGKGNDAGSAYVFVRSGATWTQQAKLIPTVTCSYCHAGWSVAVEGDLAVVGVIQAPGRGAVAVFTRSGSTWTQSAVLSNPDRTAYSTFGMDVALDGGTVVVGSDAVNNPDGAAFVYEGSGRNWALQATLTSPEPGALSFGWQVDIDGDRIVVAEPEAEVDGVTDAGAAHVFERIGSTWQATAQLLAEDRHTYDGFGHDVKLSGRYLAVSSYIYPDLSYQGGVFMFRQRSDGGWTQATLLQAPVPAAPKRFGFAIDLDESASNGLTLVSGEPERGSGAAYIYRR